MAEITISCHRPNQGFVRSLYALSSLIKRRNSDYTESKQVINAKGMT